ncbi:MAG TPA: signal peptidase I [Steroidobacteraceae bacterium]|nr:signal peptidase I [Steroidobacteraceae bacterium]
MFEQIILVLSWLLWPVLAIVVVDDWFLRPRRRLAALPATAGEAPWLKILYAALPVLLVAGAVRLFRSERLDFALVLVVVSVVGGVIWALDRWLLAPVRVRAAVRAGLKSDAVAEPGIVDYARSMVPVVVVVLLLRSFLFEPFRIPSDSMMPTLHDGDFILVNKFSYGLRLPVLNTKILDLGLPGLGDVVVFRYPRDRKVNYIKRVVGLPGDRVKVISDRIYVNGEPLPETEVGRYSDGCYDNMRQTEVQIGRHRHQALSCLTDQPLGSFPLPGCDRQIGRSYPCNEDPALLASPGVTDRGDREEVTVPAGNYLMIGDNRDNSEDGRYWGEGGATWGFVPEENLVGSAKRVWFNLDWDRAWPGKIDWGRIGERID